jgi:uncharacterized protein YbaA (DUF1428 family)/uncharacterized glyoxalase superfamily protein PhnB
MTYTDLFVLPLPTANRDAYRKLAELGAAVWTEHGALSYVEVEADDVKPGKWTSFPQSVALKDDEVVIAAVITYRSRAHRDEVNGKVMKDPRMGGMDPKSMPFDMKRMFFGGFKPFVGSGPKAPSVIQPYVFFRGRCEEAINYYKDKLGAEVSMLMRFSDNPDKPPRDKVPAEMDQKVMHAEIIVAGATLMLSDGMKGGSMDNPAVSLSLSVSSEAEADRLFNALAADGRIEMPMGPAFFAKRFGAVVDKFGISWMIMVPPAA